MTNFTIQIDEQIYTQNEQGLEWLNDGWNKNKTRVATHKMSRDLKGVDNGWNNYGSRVVYLGIQMVQQMHTQDE